MPKLSKRPKVKIHIENKGALTSLGYSLHDSKAKRIKALKKSVNKYGYPTTMKRVNALYVFNKRKRAMATKLKADKKWLSYHYGGSKKKRSKKGGKKSKRKSKRRSRKKSKKKGKKRSKKRSRKRSKKRSRKRGRMGFSSPKGCVRKHTKKYSSRPGPPFPAQECQGKTKRGNDGRMYVSKRASNGVYRWIKK